MIPRPWGKSQNRVCNYYTSEVIKLSALLQHSFLSPPWLPPSSLPLSPPPLLSSMNFCFFFLCRYRYNSSAHILPHVTKVNTEFFVPVPDGMGCEESTTEAWVMLGESLQLSLLSCLVFLSEFWSRRLMMTGQSEGGQGLLTYLLSAHSRMEGKETERAGRRNSTILPHNLHV